MKNKRKILLVIGSLILLCILVLLASIGLNKKELKEYKVTFQNEDYNITIYVKEKELVSRLENPTKEGFKFIGWYYNDSLFDFNTKIDHDITLEARWEEIIEDETSSEGNVQDPTTDNPIDSNNETPNVESSGNDNNNSESTGENVQSSGGNVGNNPQSGGNSGNSSTPQTPSTGNSSTSQPGTTQTPGTTGNSGTAQTPGTTGNSGTTQTPGTAGNSGTAQTPGNTGGSSSSGTGSGSGSTQTTPTYTIHLTARYLLDKIKNYGYEIYKNGVVFEDYQFMDISGSRYRKGDFIDPETVSENGTNAVTVYLTDGSTVTASVK